MNNYELADMNENLLLLCEEDEEQHFFELDYQEEEV